MRRTIGLCGTALLLATSCSSQAHVTGDCASGPRACATPPTSAATRTPAASSASTAASSAPIGDDAGEGSGDMETAVTVAPVEAGRQLTFPVSGGTLPPIVMQRITNASMRFAPSTDPAKYGISLPTPVGDGTLVNNFSATATTTADGRIQLSSNAVFTFIDQRPIHDILATVQQLLGVTADNSVIVDNNLTPLTSAGELHSVSQQITPLEGNGPTWDLSGHEFGGILAHLHNLRIVRTDTATAGQLPAIPPAAAATTSDVDTAATSITGTVTGWKITAGIPAEDGSTFQVVVMITHTVGDAQQAAALLATAVGGTAFTRDANTVIVTASSSTWAVTASTATLTAASTWGQQ